MTIRNIEKLFSPSSVALYGASDRKGSIGRTVMNNLYADFKGTVWLVNPSHSEIAGVPCYRDTASLPGIPDLAVIAVPPRYVPDIIRDLGEKGTRAAVVITAGFRQEGLTDELVEAAKRHDLRIIGPNCFGLLVPGTGLNASFAHGMPLNGELALLSQSGAIISAILDWSRDAGKGFSAMVSMGDMVDVDLGDMLDYLAADTHTRAILMYLEQVTDARKFMSAARSAARVKPVIVIKSGRHAEAAKAAHSHTGALAGSDAVYNAAFRRAGILRVTDLEDLFDAAEILSHLKAVHGDRLAIITNGGGAGVLAVDRLIDFGGTLADLSEETLARLDQALPDNWSKGNPVDIIGDAGPERYEQAMEIVLEDPCVDAVMVINCPTALASSTEAAKATLRSIDRNNRKFIHPKAVLTAWLGDGAAQESRALFAAEGYPTFHTPEDAVRGFSYLTRHARDQRALMQTPPSLPEGFHTDAAEARKVIAAATGSGRTLLTEPEAKAVLKAYGIPTVETVIAAHPQEVEKAAQQFLARGCKDVAVKILSVDISHKSDMGGVKLGLSDAATARQAAEEMLAAIGAALPEANIEGFTVQPMIRRPGAHELIIGVSEDATFGPIIMFGAGGTAVEVIRDTAMALPPLDLKLARDLMEETRVFKLLKGYRDRPAAHLSAIELALVRISQMVAELPEITELDINPLLADEAGVIALDARIVAGGGEAAPEGKLNPRLAIRPYPSEWEQRETLPEGRSILIRPIRPEDEKYYDVFMEKTDPEDIRLRLFVPLRKLQHEFIARLTQIDYARAMAFIAIDPDSDEMLGISRLAADPDNVRAEYAVITRTDMKGHGLGWALMQRLIHYAEAEKIEELWGQVAIENHTMLQMCRELGFEIHQEPTDASLKLVTLSLPVKKP
ncbi:bifunctional acetate--CoA ligase family protein/GNAT family N-acetyltransferase [Emcibacter nanhaiensis]|uniref:Bifunctional acetate--CoA ligase family protein/GNAT family N-acetyltransferase n=1 Tax=Emcibacter nanhaiensis TaxID=1505037 RepID=A0A501PFY2_9PROT|nr:bifunctional acetate--CoA ligase family protein/GNAT family N-acetyltransferase [Emcibacter nanhaiensis]TPD59085.1 bifunctional acetate--CoA ligase family protein/GNAT family N-acetyltransferase [Emcibacter nanhaiensis]